MATTGQRYGLLASLAAVMAAALGFLVYNYTGVTGTSDGGPVTDQPVQDIVSLERMPATVSDAGQDRAGNQPFVKNEDREKAANVSVSVNAAGVLIAADEASLQQVLDALVSKALVEVVDLRPASELAMEPERGDKRTFRITGSVDDVLRLVMDHYNYSYVISRSPGGGTVETQLAKLFLYGTSQGNDPSSADTEYDSAANSGTVPTLDTSTAGAVSGREKVNISDVLRRRALSTSGQPVTPSTGGTSQGDGDEMQAGGSLTPGAVSSSGQEASFRNTAPISGDYQDKETQARLAEMARQASREVEALAEGLRAAEQALKAQQQNQFGDTQQ